MDAKADLALQLRAPLTGASSGIGRVLARHPVVRSLTGGGRIDLLDQ